tara:strand:+ start:317 stop:562 length:246 start_codon:yes stop_codon:yes gene_type:complete
MPKVKLITIKNKLNSFTRTLGEPEFNNMIDKADYDIISAEKSVSPSPSKSWTNAELKEYMDSNSIEYNSGDTKQDLLDKIG